MKDVGEGTIHVHPCQRSVGVMFVKSCSSSVKTWTLKKDFLVVAVV